MERVKLLVFIVLLAAGSSGAQSLQLFSSLPPDWEGKIPEAYDIRLLDVSNDGRAVVGFISRENVRKYNGHDGSQWVGEDRDLVSYTSGDFEPIIVQDGHIKYLPVPPNGDYYGGYACRISRDGNWIVGGRKISPAHNGIGSYYDTAKWDQAGNYSNLGLGNSMPTCISSDGTVVGGRLPNFVGYVVVAGVIHEFPGMSPYDAVPDGSGFAWQGGDGDFGWYAISGDGSAQFGVYYPGGICGIDLYSVRRDAEGTKTIWTSCCCDTIHFTDSNPDGSLAIGREHGIDVFDFYSVSYVWTELGGVQEFGAYLLSRGIDLWQYLGGDDHLVVTAMNDDATVFVGYIKRGGRLFGGEGRDIGWIADTRSVCDPDLTGDGVLDLFDFLAFVNFFNASDPTADCDGDISFTLFDFLCFTNAFNAGC